ncbi:MAG: ornithine cyclodeaminase family protein [Bryobacteraceae bacterium]|nr:ornithine cyclodeaminase family protein [Bryobacteraceae bacterium]
MDRFSEDDVRRLLSMKEAIAQLHVAFTDFAAGHAQNHPRRRLTLQTGSVLHSLAGACGNYFGTKVYSTHPEFGANFTLLLYDAKTARPLAQFEADWLGQIRTGAVSGLAADILAPRKDLIVGCIGTGFQARGQLEALATVRSLSAVRVWSRHQEKRDKFAREMTEILGLPVVAPATVGDTVSMADVLITATWAKDPVIDEAAVPEGCLVLAVGSNNPQRRELPAELVRRSFVIVDDKEACRIEAGDLLLAFNPEHWDAAVDLKNVVSDPSATLARQGKTAIFKSVGLGLEDVAVASYVYERANPAR